MLKKYNIAYVPTINPNQFIDCAHELSKHIHPATYLLGAESLPHVSLCHFEVEESNIENIWRQVMALNIEPTKLIFDSQRSKSYPGHPKWGGVFWISLMSDKLTELKKIHLNIANHIITEPLNASFDAYDPHLTLLNSYDERESTVLNENSKLSNPIRDEFCVALGNIDDNGQLLNILYSQNEQIYCDDLKRPII
ncbi:MAG: hypothetical protein KBD83_06905 [Gammaproteobacteria bacterium]|nr:hypothetical protein [Gammaproteobacteria bacterium]